jgi:phenylalanyl-tRNA synthetase beta chain
VVVRKAKEGEKFVTLDEVERALNKEVLLITNGMKPVAIGGIMGGLESEVTSDTHAVLLESAYFDPKVIRRGRMFLDLSTESSQRFERGADPNGVIKAINRAAQLLTDLAEGKVLKGVVDNYPSVIQPIQVTLRPQRVNRILNTDLATQQIKDILTNLQIPVKEKAELEVEVPTFRPDLTREIDLIEEIARIYGYGNIKTTMHAGGNLVTEIHREDEILGEIRQFMWGKGFLEVITNNLVDPDLLKRLNPGVPAVEIKNPLSRDLSVLTTSLAYNSLSVISWNKNRLEKDIRIFELAKVFTVSDSSSPREEHHLGIALSGSRLPTHWDTKETEVNLYDLKGVVEELSSHLSLPLDLIPGNHILFDPEECFMVIMGDDFIGLMGKISTEILDLFEIKDEVLWAELDADKMILRVPLTRGFSPLPKFPPIDRDIAVVVDEELLSKEIIDQIKKTGGELVEDVILFDVYTGKQIEPGKKSLACSIRYRSPDKTLTDEEVEDIHRKVILQLERSFGATLRQ